MDALWYDVYRKGVLIARKGRYPLESTWFKPSFMCVGVDNFCPIEVKKGKSRVKRYGCIFICLSFRATHTEISNILNTNPMINALKRFIWLRGCPEKIRNNCETNFAKTDRELKEAIEEWNQQRINRICAEWGTHWILNPPGATHMEGAWKRMIRSVRQNLKALLKVICDEVLHTVFTETINILNSRPVIRNSDDPMDEDPFTLNHQLQLRPCSSLPPDGLFCRCHWRQAQNMSNLFWRRWIIEYIPTLQEREKWKDPKEILKVGSVFLLANENVPQRNEWPLARIIEVF